jgi:hypothetical protein
MTVKFFSNYDSSANLLKRFMANYPVWDTALEFTIAEDYDYAVVFNRTKEYIQTDAKIITVIQEPSWSPAHADTSFLQHSDFLIIHDPALFEKTHGIKLGGKVIESPAYLFFHDHVDKTFFHYATNTEKIRKLSMIVSHLDYPIGIYQKRFNLVRQILDSDLDIDIYGSGWTTNDTRFKGFVDYKFTALLPYQYSIAIENSEERNYVTEKFVDCVLCDTIPIYHGAPNISEIYDDKYFWTIDLESDRVIEDIKRIVNAPLRSSTANKTKYFNDYNLYKKLKELILPATTESFSG